jgi:hypothetical protein
MIFPVVGIPAHNINSPFPKNTNPLSIDIRKLFWCWRTFEIPFSH